MKWLILQNVASNDPDTRRSTPYVQSKMNALSE